MVEKSRTAADVLVEALLKSGVPVEMVDDVLAAVWRAGIDVVWSDRKKERPDERRRQAI